MWYFQKSTKQFFGGDPFECPFPKGPDRINYPKTYQPPQSLLDLPPTYLAVDGDVVREATVEEKILVDAVERAAKASRVIAERNITLEAAAVIVETIDATDDPVLLAVRELVMVLMEEIQAMKGGKPKASKSWDEHKKATAARLRANKT